MKAASPSLRSTKLRTTFVLLLMAALRVGAQTPAIAELVVNGLSTDGAEFYLNAEGEPLLPALLVRSHLEGIAKPELIDAVAGRDRLVSAADLALVGIKLSYDPDRLILNIQVPPRARLPLELEARPRKQRPQGEALRPELFSAFLGLSGELRPDWNLDLGQEGLALPFSIGVKPSLQLGGLVAEASAELGNDYEYYTKLESAALVYDFPASATRLRLGYFDTKTTSYQVSAPLLGIAAYRDSSLPGAAASRPSYGELELEESATVTIELNGMPLRRLKLEPGAYRLSDLPLATGLNDVVITIAELGKETRRIRLGLPYDGQLLGAGVLDWFAAAGYSLEDGREPFGSAYAAYGIGGRATFGVNAEAGFGVFLGGASILWASPLGTLALEPALSYAYEEASPMAEPRVRALWRLALPGAAYLPRLGLGFEYRAARFAPPPVSGPPAGNPVLEDAYRYSAQIFQALPGGGGLSAAAELALAEAEAFRGLSVSAGIFQPLTGSAFASLSGSLDFDQHGSFTPSLSLALSVTAPDRYSLSYRNNLIDRSASFDLGIPLSKDESRSLSLRGEGIPAAGADGSREVGALGRASTSWADFTASTRYLEDEGSRRIGLGLSIGTGLVLAGGRISMTKAPGGSFVLLMPDSSLEGQKIELRGVDGSLRAMSRAGEPVFGADLQAYERIPLRVEVPESPPEIAVRQQSILIDTGYRTVTVIRPEAVSSVSVRGRLMSGGKPVPNLYGVVAPLSGQGPGADTFTDADGVFYCYELARGSYEIRWLNGAVSRFSLDRGAGLLDLGDVKPDATSGREGP